MALCHNLLKKNDPNSERTIPVCKTKKFIFFAGNATKKKKKHGRFPWQSKKRHTDIHVMWQWFVMLCWNQKKFGWRSVMPRLLPDCNRITLPNQQSHSNNNPSWELKKTQILRIDFSQIFFCSSKAWRIIVTSHECPCVAFCFVKETFHAFFVFFFLRFQEKKTHFLVLKTGVVRSLFVSFF